MENSLVEQLIEQACKKEIAFKMSDFMFLVNKRLDILENKISSFIIKKDEKRSFAYVNQPWHPYEQRELEDEISEYIHKKACEYKRSNRAINIRIQDILNKLTGPKKY